MNKLKKCPFCGSNNTVLDYYEISGPQEIGTLVVCNNCGASAKSIADWNTRSIEKALTARIADWHTRSTKKVLTARIAELEGAMKEAFEVIGSVVACCTYGTQEDAKVGMYGISHEAFTKIDQFIRKNNGVLNKGEI